KNRICSLRGAPRGRHAHSHNKNQFEKEETTVRDRRSILALIATFMFFCVAGATQPVHAQSDFFAGKTINLLVGFGPGGANDVWARVISKHLPKHLPG